MRHPALSALSLLLLAGSAQAQHALGDGRGLERNSRVGSGGSNYQRADFSSEIRLRNAVVTGNISGGRSLQTGVGYVDSNDFRIALPSESLFRFRRDSFSAGSVGARGTEGLQYQYAQSTGNAMFNRGGAFYYGNPVPGSSTGKSTTASPWAPRPEAMLMGSEDSGLRMGTLRATSAFTTTRSMTPSLVGYQRSSTGLQMMRLTASGLLGIRKEPVDLAAMAGLPADAREDRSKPAANAVDLSASNAVPATTAYEELIGRLGSKLPDPVVLQTQPGEVKPDVKPEATPGARPDKPEEKPGPTPGVGAAALPRLGEVRPWESHIDRMRIEIARSYARILNAPKPKEGEPQAADATPEIDENVIKAIRESGTTSSTFFVGQARPGDFFGSYMQEGETYMSQLRFFDAEEHFARALAMRPGDVNAMVGRMHAQLGAGLLVSAAMNLRLLYEQHPEVMAQRWAGTTFPAPERMNALVADLRANVARTKSMKFSPPPESAILLAYVGFQRGDTAMMREGLALVREAAADGNPRDGVLAAVLERVWNVGPSK